MSAARPCDSLFEPSPLHGTAVPGVSRRQEHPWIK